MAETQLGPTAQKVLAYLQQNRGSAFAVGDVCEAVDCSTSEAQTALETLAQEGLVERQQSTGSVALYTAR
jgi:DNA-binding IclR family transcriptional regulator